MRARALITVAAVTLLGSGPAAVASKARPACAITDQVGDVPSDAFDIVCADVAFGKKTIIGVLQVVSLTDEPLYEGTAGATWELSFSVGRTRHTFARHRYAGPTQTYGYTFDGRPVAAMLTRDVIVWTAPRSSVPGAKSARSRATAMYATATGLLSRDTAGTAPKRR